MKFLKDNYENIIRGFSALIVVYIVYFNHQQQVIAVFCLLLATFGLRGVERVFDLVLEKMAKAKKGSLPGGISFEEGETAERPEELKGSKKLNEDIHFHRLVAAGKNYLQEGYIDESIKCFQEALEIKEDDFDLTIMLGFIFGEKKKDAKTGVRYFQKALSFEPKSLVALFNLAVYTNHLEGPEKSLPIYLQAEELIIEREQEKTELNGKLNLFVGHDLKNTNKKEEARNRYEKAKEIFENLKSQGSPTADFWLNDTIQNISKLNKDYF